MKSENKMMKTPEFLVFAKMFVVGWIAAEVFRAAYYVGAAFAPKMASFPLWANIALVMFGLVICVTYAVNRGAHSFAMRMARSLRFDLFVAICAGAWANELTLPWLSRLHAVLKAADPYWAPIVLLLGFTVIISPLVQRHWARRQPPSPPYFLADDEITREKDDLLSNKIQAKLFAETVLASGAHAGLAFGVDGPWGVGKTSFINLAERYWEEAEDKVIVCRFEPLRYASEPDLVDRLIRDLSAAIQTRVFAPEFRRAASRYSRLIKGKADVSFLGFKLSLEPSQETVDELLDDIDDVLRRIGRRVIIVIDDLDRLDSKAVNNVLFATRRTFKLSQATYVLCYDTEVLASGKEDEIRAREFLEKFVTVKLSLFVDSSSIQNFLRRDWDQTKNQLKFVPSDTMLKLGAILNELATILNSKNAARYLPLIGDLRKIKRFINAIVLMQMEKTDLGRTDFNKRDLIHLMLLHMNYPGLFRRIYAEETEGRSGIFSIQRESGKSEFKNAEGFSEVLAIHKNADGFLLGQLFDIRILNIQGNQNIAEQVFRSRACFNNFRHRNLENYLKLIVRFETPEPQETFALYQNAVDEVRKGKSITSVLSGPDFSLKRTEKSHDEFWRVLVNEASDFNNTTAEDAIKTLVENLPRYSSFDNGDRGLRPRSIYSLLRLLDRTGWGRTAGLRLVNSSENVVEIAHRLFGEQAFDGKSLLEQLVSSERGVLGWSDLMLFRLECSADRGGPLHNLQKALIVHQDMSAPTTGLVSELTLQGMRKLSQQVFALFKRNYIDAGRNFIAEAHEVPIRALLGDAFVHLCEQALHDPVGEQGEADNARRALVARFRTASFVIFELANVLAPNGSGVGCGYYDEIGTADGGGISRLMNEYVFDFCFNPQVDSNNVFRFLDHCLSHLSSPFHIGRDEDGFIPTKQGLPGGLDPKAMGTYWLQHGEQIRALKLDKFERCVFMSGYTAFYRDHLVGVFDVLDELAKDSAAV